jgi:hypothetical protein
LVLHAGCAVHAGDGVLVLGPSGIGKSTLVAGLGSAGWSVLGDDAVIVTQEEDTWVATAVNPTLRLLPDSLSSLFPSPQAGSAVAQYTTKRQVSFSAPAPARAPISALFFLHCDSAVGVRAMRPSETCMGLITNSFALDPTDARRAGSRLHSAAAISASTPAYELTYPRDFSRLPEVREVISSQLRRAPPNG